MRLRPFQVCAGGSSGSSSGSGRGLFAVTFETGNAFISLELDEYTVTIQRTADLNGQSVWGSKWTETGGTGFFTGGSANFYDMPLGYYTVEAFGYNSDQKVYGSAWRNVQHKCEHSVVTKPAIH